MDELELELKTTFLNQAVQLVADAEQCFLDLEEDPSNRDTLDKIFRIMHNMKGSANGVGFSEIGDFTHNFESLLLRLKNGDIRANQPMVDLLLKSNDAVTHMVNTLRGNMAATFDNKVLTGQLEAAIKNNGFPDVVHAAPAKSLAPTPASAPQVTQPAVVAAPKPVARRPAPAATAMDRTSVRNGEPTQYKIQPGERFLNFTLGPDEFAIPLLSVKQVIAIPEFTPIPQSPGYFAGLANLRGAVIPVLDIAAKLNISSNESTERAVIILNIGAIVVGIIVDSVNQVIAPKTNELSPRPETDPSVKTDYIIAVYRRDKQLVLLLDIAMALGTQDWQIVRGETESMDSMQAA